MEAQSDLFKITQSEPGFKHKLSCLQNPYSSRYSMQPFPINFCLTITPTVIHIHRFQWKAISQIEEMRRSYFLLTIYPTVWFLLDPRHFNQSPLTCYVISTTNTCVTWLVVEHTSGDNYHVLPDFQLTQPQVLLTILKSGLNRAR